MKKIVYLLFFTVFICSQCAHGAIKVTPTLIELNANKVNSNYLTTSFDVQGGDDETIRFKVYPAFFRITNQGTMEVIEGAEKNTAVDSLVNYARFVPNEFTLVKGKTQKVRLTVANLNQMPDGESRMVLFLEDVVAKEMYLPNQNPNVKTKLIVKTRVGIPVYVDCGRFIKSANIEDLKVEKQKDAFISTLKLVSNGNSKVRYRGKAQIIKDKKLIDEYVIKNNVAGSNNILDVNEVIPVDKITENGEYTLRMIINYSDEKDKPKTLIKETIFKIENIKPSSI